MEEFRKIKWGIQDLSELEKQQEFITEECLSGSLIFSNFEEPLAKKKMCVHENENSKQFVPGKPLHKYHLSALREKEQCECLAAMKILQSGKDPTKFTASEQYKINFYNRFHDKIKIENAAFLRVAQENFTRFKPRLTKVKPSLLQYAENCWRSALTRYLDYGKFYENICMLSLSCTEDEISVQMANTKNLLEVGSVAKCSLPSLKSQITLKLATLPPNTKENLTYSKLPVSTDKNIENLLENNHFHIVISSSGLNKIMHGSDVNEDWDLPVLVKQIKVGETVKNVVYIDKPLPKKHPTNAYFSHKCTKLMLRTNFCKYEAFSFPDKEVPFFQNLEKEEVKTPDKNDETVAKRKQPINTIHHNVSYRLWTINQQTEHSQLMKTKFDSKEITVLIRTKLDGCEALDDGKLQPVTLSPKMEYQLEFGGNLAGKEELSKEWNSLFFRPFSKLYRVRIDYTKLEMVLKENCTLQKINSEAHANYQHKPHTHLTVLYKIFTELAKLEPGKYLLHYVPKFGQFVALLKECSSKTSDSYNLHEEYDICAARRTNEAWHPIDVNLILPMHTSCNRMPGLFHPRPNYVHKKGAKKKGKPGKSGK